MQSTDSSPSATILIVTRNRKQMAGRAIRSALAQEGNVEVVVVDDGSTDGTSEFVRSEFPSVRVIRTEDQRGCVVQRTQAAREAHGKVLVSIDDDAEFIDPHVVRDILQMFDHPRIAAVMIPHVNCDDQKIIRWAAPIARSDGKRYAAGAFIGTAYAVDTTIFNSLGGFQGYLFQWGEEGEFSQRLTNAGYVIVAGTVHRVRHYPNWAGKYSRKLLSYIYRNRILTVWLDAPTSLLLPLLAGQTAHALMMCVKKPRELLAPAEGCIKGYLAMLLKPRLRKPIKMSAYRLWLDLRRREMIPFDEVIARIEFEPLR